MIERVKGREIKRNYSLIRDLKNLCICLDSKIISSDSSRRNAIVVVTVTLLYNVMLSEICTYSEA